LQHAPQETHWPLRLSATGRKAVTVLFAFAGHVFWIFSAIIKCLPVNILRRIMAEFSRKVKQISLFRRDT
jgi:hypothetical protein